MAPFWYHHFLPVGDFTLYGLLDLSSSSNIPTSPGLRGPSVESPNRVYSVDKTTRSPTDKVNNEDVLAEGGERGAGERDDAFLGILNLTLWPGDVFGGHVS